MSRFGRISPEFAGLGYWSAIILDAPKQAQISPNPQVFAPKLFPIFPGVPRATDANPAPNGAARGAGPKNRTIPNTHQGVREPPKIS